MFEFTKFLTDLKVVRDAIKAGGVADIVDSLLALGQDISPLVRLVFGGTFAATCPVAGECYDEAAGCVSDITAACGERCQAIPVSAAGDEVGKIGDGQIIKVLLENLPNVLAFVLTLLKKAD